MFHSPYRAPIAGLNPVFNTALGLTTRQAAQYIKDAMETLDEETEDDDGEMS